MFLCIKRFGSDFTKNQWNIRNFHRETVLKQMESINKQTRAITAASIPIIVLVSFKNAFGSGMWKCVDNPDVNSCVAFVHSELL